MQVSRVIIDFERKTSYISGKKLNATLNIDGESRYLHESATEAKASKREGDERKKTSKPKRSKHTVPDASVTLEQIVVEGLRTNSHQVTLPI